MTRKGDVGEGRPGNRGTEKMREVGRAGREWGDGCKKRELWRGFFLFGESRSSRDGIEERSCGTREVWSPWRMRMGDRRDEIRIEKLREAARVRRG